MKRRHGQRSAQFLWSGYHRTNHTYQAADEEAKKAVNHAQQLKHANVSPNNHCPPITDYDQHPQDKFQAKIQDLQRSRDRANTELANALEKVKAATSAENAAPSTVELTNQHAKELEDLRAQLAAQHESALKEAVDAATMAAKAEATRAFADGPTKAAIDAAIAAHEQESKPKYNEEIEKAVDRGRMEQAAKMKIKDGQVVRLQSKVKELESRILEWEKLGLVPDPNSTSLTAPLASSTSAASVSNVPLPNRPPGATATTIATPTSSTPSASTAPALPAAAATAPLATSLGPRKATSGAVPLSVSGLRGRGRGGAVGAPRGAPGIRGRGGAPSPTVATAPAQVENFSILGAASKRGREEDPTSDGDSLAKRIKPAESTDGNGDAPTAGGSANKPPVQIRRPQGSHP